MLVLIVVLVVLLIVAAGGAALLLRARSGARDSGMAVSATGAVLVPSVADKRQLDLDQVLALPDSVLYLPTADATTFLAIAAPDTEVPGATSKVPTQLVAAAVAGQAAVEGLVKAGQISGRLVLVDPKTAEAIRAGTIVTDKAGEMLGIIRGAKGFAGLTRMKPVPGSLVKGALSGPAMLSTIATQMQMARIEKSIGEVRDLVTAVQSHLEETERASVQGRRELLRKVYRTAHESEAMTQPLWDQIQHLEDLLIRDVELADRHLERVTRRLEENDARLVGKRARAIEGAGDDVSAAVARVADARRALVQFSMLRLWWLAVTDDPTLVSQQRQLLELLEGLPDHQVERERVEAALGEIAMAKVHQRVLAPVKQKALPVAKDAAVETLTGLPWTVIDVRPERHPR